MQTIGFTLEREGLPAPAEQQAALGPVDELRAFRAITREDAESALRSALELLEPGDLLVVSGLEVLSMGERSLSAVLAALSERGLELMASAQEVDTRRDTAFLQGAAQIEAGVQAARLANARAVITRAAKRGAQTPPKAEFIPIEFAGELDR
jgi:hypothetical protein